MSRDLRADVDRLERKLDHILLAVLHLLTRPAAMSNKEDFLAALAKNDAALTSNDDAMLSVGRNVDALIAAHGDSDAMFADALAKVAAQGTHISGQGQAIAALGQKIGAALPVAEVEGASVEPAAAEPAAAEQPTAAPIGLVPGTLG